MTAVERDAELATLIRQRRALDQRIAVLSRPSAGHRGGAPTAAAHANEARSEVSAPSAVLDALQAHVALLDAQARIVFVNRAWREFAAANGLPDPEGGVGRDYVEVCESAQGSGSAEARAAARGVRAVLSGDLPGFSLEYPCHSPEARRWFRMVVTPMDAEALRVLILHVDITERVLAEQHRQELLDRLTEERERLVQAQEVARMGSWGTDLRSGTVAWSAMTHRIFETDPETFAPTHERFLALVHPEDRLAVDAAFVASQRLQAPQSIEHRVLLPDGRVKTVEERWRIFRDEADRPLRALGTCLDITERRTAELRLRESQSMVRLAGHMARLGAWAVEWPAMTVLWSDIVTDIHDLPAGTSPRWEEALDHYEPRHRETVRACLTRCATDGRPFDLEAPILTATGRPRWVRVIGQAERDGAGSIVRVHGAMQDVTERKLAEQTAQELAERLQTTLESITDGFFTLDREWRFTYLNRRAEQLLMRERSGLLGRNVWVEFPQAPGSVAQPECVRAATQGVATSFQYHEPRLDRWFESHVYPSTQGLAVYFRDITDAKKAHDAVRELNIELEARVLARTAELDKAREEAEQASRAKSAFLATMSHEIRTPMNGVVGMVDVLRQTSLEGAQAEMVELIRDSAESLLTIIDDILDLSKIEAGRMELDEAPMHLGDLVERVCEMLDHTAIRRGVRMTVFVDPGIPEFLVGDEARLRQVLVNLVGNAIKFCSGTGRPGHVAIRARSIEADEGSATFELSVADNGIGMDEDTVARLFRPFVQGDPTTTRRFGGTGLGLAISGTLVTLMGGQVMVRSSEGEGATFTIRLTLARAEREARSDPAADMLAGLRCCIVGVELPLAEDVDAYLRHAGAVTRRVAQVSDAVAADLWLLLPGTWTPPPRTPDECSPRAGGIAGRQLRLGSGNRRRPRIERDHAVHLDHEGMTRRSLYHAVALASGRLAAKDGWRLPAATRRDRAPRSHPTSTHGPRRILVAEDNDINRKVVQQQLHLLGLDAEFAEDGQAALERWRGGGFLHLLTDLHMPRMDGYALAAAIRAEEAASGRPRTAIIALTANALRGEEARCLAAGMDGYLSKPVRLERLRAALRPWTSAQLPDAARGETPQPGQPELRTPGASPVDLGALKALVGDDEAVIARMVRSFLASAADSCASLTQALAAADVAAMAEAAHKLRSGALTVGASVLGGLCDEVEQALAHGSSPDLEALIATVNAELCVVREALQRH